MCRNIRPLYNFEPPATTDEVRAAALQYVRKISGYRKPSRANEEAFARAVDDIAEFLSLEAPHVPARRRRGSSKVEGMSREELEKLVITLEEEMFTAAEELRFEYAAKLRDEIKELRRELSALVEA